MLIVLAASVERVLRLAWRPQQQRRRRQSDPDDANHHHPHVQPANDTTKGTGAAAASAQRVGLCRRTGAVGRPSRPSRTRRIVTAVNADQLLCDEDEACPPNHHCAHRERPLTHFDHSFNVQQPQHCCSGTIHTRAAHLHSTVQTSSFGTTEHSEEWKNLRNWLDHGRACAYQSPQTSTTTLLRRLDGLDSFTTTMALCTALILCVLLLLLGIVYWLFLRHHRPPPDCQREDSTDRIEATVTGVATKKRTFQLDRRGPTRRHKPQDWCTTVDKNGNDVSSRDCTSTDPVSDDTTTSTTPHTGILEDDSESVSPRISFVSVVSSKHALMEEVATCCVTAEEDTHSVVARSVPDDGDWYLDDGCSMISDLSSSQSCGYRASTAVERGHTWMGAPQNSVRQRNETIPQLLGLEKGKDFGMGQDVRTSMARQICHGRSNAKSSQSRANGNEHDNLACTGTQPWWYRVNETELTTVPLKAFDCNTAYDLSGQRPPCEPTPTSLGQPCRTDSSTIATSVQDEHKKDFANNDPLPSEDHTILFETCLTGRYGEVRPAEDDHIQLNTVLTGRYHNTASPRIMNVNTVSSSKHTAILGPSVKEDDCELLRQETVSSSEYSVQVQSKESEQHVLAQDIFASNIGCVAQRIPSTYPLSVRIQAADAKACTLDSFTSTSSRVECWNGTISSSAAREPKQNMMLSGQSAIESGSLGGPSCGVAARDEINLVDRNKPCTRGGGDSNRIRWHREKKQESESPSNQVLAESSKIAQSDFARDSTFQTRQSPKQNMENFEVDLTCCVPFWKFPKSMMCEFEEQTSIPSNIEVRLPLPVKSINASFCDQKS